MADFADIADELSAQHLEDSLRKHREHAARTSALLGAHNGKCLNCGEAIAHGRFCETTLEDEQQYGSCRTDWELRNRHRVSYPVHTDVGSLEDCFDDAEVLLVEAQL